MHTHTRAHTRTGKDPVPIKKDVFTYNNLLNQSNKDRVNSKEFYRMCVCVCVCVCVCGASISTYIVFNEHNIRTHTCTHKHTHAHTQPFDLNSLSLE